MRILVTGASGLLGLNLSLLLSQDHEVFGVVNKNQLDGAPFNIITADLCRDGQVLSLIEKINPDLVINCAAAADIDWCETNEEYASVLNALVPKFFAEVCHRHGIKFLQISTDAVFDGKQVEYTEEEEPNPQSVYAKTKLDGERFVLKQCPGAIIARVNFYGYSISSRRSLAEFFINNLSTGKKVNGFVDVLFCPLYVKDLVDILMQMVEKNLEGLFHVVSNESISKYAFGIKIAEIFDYDKNLINPISVNESELTAKRSPLLMLNIDKLKGQGINPPGQSTGIIHLYEDYQNGLAQKISSYKKSYS